MGKFNPVEAWLNNVAYSHSVSKETAYNYRHYLKAFCTFIGSTPQQILDEYEETNDRQFRRKYAQCLRAFISNAVREGFAVGSAKTISGIVRSFFKYNDLPLGFVPVAKRKITYHNRELEREEIVHILRVSGPRDKAFFGMMAQSGLRPDTLCRLRLKHVEDRFGEGKKACCITVPEEIAKGEFGAYFTFMGKESIKYLKAYLDTRPGIGPEDYLFTNRGTDMPLNKKSISGIFRKSIEKLKAKGLLDFEQKKAGKPREVRLYNLRKFFRKGAGNAGIEEANFWMGHKANYKAPHIPASDAHYFNREDIEYHRAKYIEKASSHLRLETPTASEYEKITEKQAKEIRDLKKNTDVQYKRMSKALDAFQQEIERLRKLVEEKES